MSKYGLYALIMAMCLWTSAESAASEDTHDHAHHDHAHHGHDLSGPELGMSVGYVHLEEDAENALGVHAHLMKRLGDEGIRRFFAIGLGAEYLFTESAHYAVMLPLSVNPWRGLVLSASPGVQWAEHEGESETAYSTHIEVTYTFPLGKYDIGPMIDHSWTDEEKHTMIGVHVGLHF